MKFRVLIAVFMVFTCQAMQNGKGVAHIPLPADLTGTLGGTAYIIRVPANWNGTLLMFAHGAGCALVGPPVAKAAPVEWPSVTPSLEDQLLAHGYALAGSGYGYDSAKEAVQRTLALTNFFKGMVGNPRRTIIWGGTVLGGTVSLKLIEDHPGVYDGAIALAPEAAGIPEDADMGLSFSLAYAAAFPWHEDLWGSVEDLRDDLDFWSDVQPKMVGPDPTNPDTLGRWEFIRLVMQLPPQAFYGIGYPPFEIPFFGMLMWKATERRAVIEAENGGPVAENVGLHYTLSAADKQYLASLGVNAEQLLAYMNAHTNITADRAARIHAGQWGGFSGRLLRPVLTVHSIFDGVNFVSQESHYAALVEAANSGDRLVQAYVNDVRVGQVSFSADQYLSVLFAMESWLDTGVRPDSSLLPESQGFDLTYIPPPWEIWPDTASRLDTSLLPASKGFDLTHMPPRWPF